MLDGRTGGDRWDMIRRSSEVVRRFAGEAIDEGFFGAVLGSGLGDVVARLDGLRSLPYAEIPGFLPTTVKGHEGALCVGRLGGSWVLALRGRVHLYEGHGEHEVVHGVRTLAHLGARAILLTNAAGGIRSDLRVGDFMVIEDHINLTARTPLLGPNDDRMGPRFPDCTRLWTPALRTALVEAGARVGLPMHQGVYVGLLGPSYETPAEIRMLRTLGADAVGMSTVLEAIAARHMGARVLGLSLITNAAAGSAGDDQVLDHADVAAVARQASSALGDVLDALLRERASWWSA